MGAYVKLLEYDNIDGMILLSELSRRRIRSIQKLIRVGRNEVVVVLRVDKEKGGEDLQKQIVAMLILSKATSISPNGESHPRISSNARNASTKGRWWHRS